MSTSHALAVNGATLYYETQGEGPVLLMIPGANGDHFIYTPIRQILSQHFTVVTYDRRGFSASTLDGPQDYTRRIETDADDAAALIRHLSDQPAYVFASSSGALVSFQLLIQHPDLIKGQVSHEPTALKALPDGDKWAAFNDGLYDIYKTEGAAAAMEKFTSTIIPGSKDGEIMKRGGNGDNPNRAYWFEHELRQYPPHDFDFDALEKQKHKLVFAVGDETGDMMPGQPNTLLAKRFGTNILYTPGAHLGYLLHPETFAEILLNCYTSIK